MTSRAKSIMLLSLVLVYYHAGVSIWDHIRTCGSTDECEGIWCKQGRLGECLTWTCDLDEYCKKLVRCDRTPEPYCMEGMCTC
ncbi:hypothetical protein N665_0293s0025 [Sinapis alba]|nr:hypothetical protein N665_0293s0025 [Sinapis alba]